MTRTWFVKNISDSEEELAVGGVVVVVAPGDRVALPVHDCKVIVKADPDIWVVERED